MAGSAVVAGERLLLEWGEICDPAGLLAGRLADLVVDPENPRQRQEFYRSVLSALVLSYFANGYADPRYPEFWPYFTTGLNWFGTNPDTNYSVSTIEDCGVYRLSGYRGTVFQVDIQIGNGAFVPHGILDEHFIGASLANYNVDELVHDADGMVEVVISSERPDGHEGNWWPLPIGGTYIMLRQISCDWLHERDGHFGIERLDVPAARPRRDVAALADGLRNYAGYAETLLRASAGLFLASARAHPRNAFSYKDVSDSGGIQSQRYAYCWFDLQPDEGLLIEIEMPRTVHYWSVHLTDTVFFSLDWINRQTSINCHTARIDPDGFLRIVVSGRDPGHPNWLDAMDYPEGVIQARWDRCSSAPEHAVRKIDLADLPDILGQVTLGVTPVERDAAIRKRRQGAQWRRKW